MRVVPKRRRAPVLSVTFLLLAGGLIVADAGSAPPVKRPATAAAEAAFGKLPLWFEANRGQAGPGVDYIVRTGGDSVALSGDGAVFRLPNGDDKPTRAPRTLRLGLVNGNGREGHGINRLGSTSNYLRGTDPAGWHTGVPHFKKVAYRDVWRGVDLVYRGKGKQIEYDFVVKPGASPSLIGMTLQGADRLELTPDGDLVASAGGAELRQSKPVVYQEVGGTRRRVAGSFVLTGPDRFGFRIGRYDTSRPLVIDPVLSWSTSLGGLFADSVNGISVDAAGSAYVTGSTASTNFPTVNPLQPAKAAGNDAFVAKLNPAGTALLWSTYLGGGGADDANAISVDGAGNATVVGTTTSTNFPVVNGFQSAKGAGAGTDAFVTRLNPNGSAPSYSTYLGGAGTDTGRGVAVDSGGRAHVTGATASTDFPVLNAFQATKSSAAAGLDAFVVQLDPSAAGAASRLYGTYLGGGADDTATAIAIDGAGRSYITGETRSGDFPTVSALKPTISGACPSVDSPGRLCREAFVAKVDPSATGASSLAWSTYLGGATSTYHLEIGEGGLGIAVDAAGSAYVTGDTFSDDFPTVNAVQPTRAGDSDAFVTKLSPAGDAIVYSTYLGGAGADVGRAIAVDPTGSAHVTGNGSPGFPRVNPIGAVASSVDAVVARLTPAGSALVHSTHLGGDVGDFGRAIAVDGAGSATVGGSSTSANFPTITPLQAAPGGDNDGFVAQIAPGPSSGPLVTGLSPRSGPYSGGTPVVITGSGLGGATTVLFGTSPATFQVESPSRIVATSPGGAGSRVVTVSTPAGASPPNPVGTFKYGEGLWSATGPQTQRRFVPTMTLLANGKVLLAGGRSLSNGPALATAEVYDPLTNTWSATGSMATPRYAHTSTLLADGKVLVAGGFTFAPPSFNNAGGFINAGPITDTAEVYDPATGAWTPAGPLATRRAIHTATLLPNGQVLAAGGRTCDEPPPTACANSRLYTNTAELYDPTTRAWRPTGPLADGRHTGDAVRLADGRVLTAGGFGPVPGDNLNSTEIYDPGSGTWSTSGPLNFARARLILVRLVDGRVLAVGGFGSQTSTELFDPATGTWTLSGGLAQARSGHCAVLLPRGDVLSPAPGSHVADLYDPGSELWRPASNSTSIHNCFSGVTRADAVVLSSNPTRFEADPAVCGRNCGKALLSGDTADQLLGDLYTPAPVVTRVTPASASRLGGTTVTITGIGFTDATEVRFGGVLSREVRVNSYSEITALVPAGAAGPADVTVLTPGGRSEPVPFSRTEPAVTPPSVPAGPGGYWLAASDGGVFAFGDAGFFGSTGGIRLNRPVVGMASTPSGKGYWMVASDGGLFAFGDARFFGSTGGIRLNRPVVGMASTPTGRGYWLVASDGGVFAFGDAAFLGSTGGIRLNQPIVGMASTASGKGYRMVASDGGIFAFGDAGFFGSTGGIRLNRPVVGMASTPSGRGYRMVASDGGIFAFGDAGFFGSTGAMRLNLPMVGMASSPTGRGYQLVASDGGVFAFGDAGFFGSTGGIRLNQPVVGMAVRSSDN